MNVFDQPDNFPPIFFHSWEYLKTHGPTPREELEGALAPASFAPTAHANVKSTISLGIRIHVFDQESELLRNSERTNDCSDFNSFRRVARDIYFDQKLNNYTDVKAHKGNLQLAAAWFHSFPFDQTPGTWTQAQKQLPKDFSLERTHWPIQNSTQWSVFERWMKFFGISINGVGGGGSTVLQPCINELVWDVLQELPKGSRTPIKNFVDALVTRFPSLPGGIAFSELPSELSGRIRTRNTALIAQALRVAARDELVTLESGVDVANREVFAVDAGDFAFDFIVKGK
jgi:hypothetical protein